MRHLVAIEIIMLKVTEDMVQSVANHVFSKPMQTALVGILKDFLASENLPELIAQCKSFEDTVKKADKKADEWKDSFKQYLKASGLDKQCDALFEGTDA